MEETRVSRTPRLRRASAPEASRPTRHEVPGETPLLDLERLALVALVLGRERAVSLLEGLGEAEARQAMAHLSRFASLPSAQRQARVAVDFGVQPAAAWKLRALMAEVSEPLRREIFRRLPPYHRSLFPERQVEPPDEAATPALCALAERLIREATR